MFSLVILNAFQQKMSACMVGRLALQSGKGGKGPVSKMGGGRGGERGGGGGVVKERGGIGWCVGVD